MALDASSTSESIHIDPNPRLCYLSDAYQEIPKDMTALCNGDVSRTNDDTAYCSNLGVSEQSERKIQGNEDMEVIDSSYEDEPELVDVCNLPEVEENVLVVSEFKKREKVDENAPPRRNPVRKARNNSRIFYNSEEFYDECVFSDDDIVMKPEKVEDEKKVVNLKEWPINVHERPEYNATTNEIEKFDYSIREISKLYTPKTESKSTAPKRARKVKRYGPPKRRRRALIEKRVPLRELRACVTETTSLVRHVAGKLELNSDLERFVLNQSILCTLLNDGRFVF